MQPYLVFISGTTPVRTLLLILTISLCTGCTAADALKLFGLGAKEGIELDAQIGDRENSLGDNVKIETENGNVSYAEKKSKFEGQAEEVTYNEVDYGLLSLGFLFGTLFGVLVGLVLPQYKVIFQRK